MPGGNETNTNKPSDADIWSLLYKLVKRLADDIENGCRPLIVCGIPQDIMEEFEKKIMSSPQHQDETSGEARDTEIRNFIFETIGKPLTKR